MVSKCTTASVIGEKSGATGKATPITRTSCARRKKVNATPKWSIVQRETAAPIIAFPLPAFHNQKSIMYISFISFIDASSRHWLTVMPNMYGNIPS
jgi:hypothetical protein